MKTFRLIATFFATSLLVTSCTKYMVMRDSDNYPDQRVYLPAAVDGISANGIYAINSVAVPGKTFRYVADVAGKKLNIPLSAYRAGTNTNGGITVTISLNTDTVAKFLAAGKFPAATELLPSDKYSVINSVTIPDGQGTGDFILSVDMNFLLANLAKKYAIGIGASVSGKSVGAAATVMVWIDPAFLVPTASFTTSISARTVNFSNTSANAATYSWDYGDGTPLSTDKAASHTYTAAGTYTIKLTVTGALGDFNKVVYSLPVVIL